ncbi:hypothetical protein KPL70_018550 [Citrus sinensis]|nr:hypothetical protein KPL70_018550 [Citrus sinensis]
MERERNGSIIFASLKEHKERLVDEEQENLEPQPECWIYRVPKAIRKANEEVYTWECSCVKYFEAYSYCELPFCPPGDPIPNREKSLQEILSNDCFTRTQYELKFKVGIVRETLCERSLTKDEVKKFRQAISNESEYHMYHNNVLLREKVGFVKPMGVTFNSRPSYYLVKHIDFYPQYYENQVVDISSVADLDSAVDITEDAEIRVRIVFIDILVSQLVPGTLTLGKGMVEFLTMSSRSVSKDASLRPANPWLLAYILGLGVQQLLM